MVERVDARLRAAGITTWWDRALSPGEQWDDWIRKERKAARCVVVVWSERSWASRWVQSEANDGYTRKILVPARIDGVTIERPFNIIQTVDLREPDGLDALVRAVEAQLAGRSDGRT